MTEHLNDMITKLTLNWLTDLSNLHAECGFFKFSDHGTFPEPAQVTAFCTGASVCGKIPSELAEIRSMFQERHNSCCLALICHQNVTCPDLLFGARGICSNHFL